MRFGSRGPSEISAFRLGCVTENTLIEKAWKDTVQGLSKGLTVTMLMISFSLQVQFTALATSATFVPRSKRWWTSSRKRQSGFHSAASEENSDILLSFMHVVKYLGVVRVGKCFGGGVEIGEYLNVKKFAVC